MRVTENLTAHPSIKSFRGWIYGWESFRDDQRVTFIFGADCCDRRIRTSAVVRLYRIDAALFIETRNSVYQLVDHGLYRRPTRKRAAH